MQVLYNAHKRVPGDWSVTGFDNTTFAEFTNPPLTTFNQPKYTLGTQAVKLLLQAMNSISPNDERSSTITLRGEILVRGSTAPPLSFV